MTNDPTGMPPIFICLGSHVHVNVNHIVSIQPHYDGSVVITLVNGREFVEGSMTPEALTAHIEATVRGYFEPDALVEPPVVEP